MMKKFRRKNRCHDLFSDHSSENRTSSSVNADLGVRVSSFNSMSRLFKSNADLTAYTELIRSLSAINLTEVEQQAILVSVSWTVFPSDRKCITYLEEVSSKMLLL
jgi:hypothetical protein